MCGSSEDIEMKWRQIPVLSGAEFNEKENGYIRNSNQRKGKCYIRSTKQSVNWSIKKKKEGHKPKNKHQ